MYRIAIIVANGANVGRLCGSISTACPVSELCLAESHYANGTPLLSSVLAQAELDFNCEPWSMTGRNKIRHTEHQINLSPAVERIKEYVEVAQEAPARVSNPPPAHWPSSEGGIVVENLLVRYAPSLPAVLKGITFSVKPREKVGVVRSSYVCVALNKVNMLINIQVGRTGSGKVYGSIDSTIPKC